MDVTPCEEPLFMALRLMFTACVWCVLWWPWCAGVCAVSMALRLLFTVCPQCVGSVPGVCACVQCSVLLALCLPFLACAWYRHGMRITGGRSNGPYTDSLPLSCLFQGGGGGGAWLGGVWGAAGGLVGGGEGAPGPQHIWLKMTALSR